MTTLMIVLLCIDVILLSALLAYVVVAILNKDKTPTTLENEVALTKQEEVAEEKEHIKEVQSEEIAQKEVEDSEDDRYVVKRVPFAQKMLTLDAKTQIYYEKIHNTFRALRNINPRISMKGVSYRKGKVLVAKISVRGKTMRLHLALDVNEFEQNVYFQKDLSDVKAYLEVPFMVKVKSDRGLKKALELIEKMCEKQAIEKKARFNAIDAVAELKEKI